jgi:hypothetical protein
MAALSCCASRAAVGEHKAKSFTIDGEAVVLGPDGLSRFEELSRREGAPTAILYAFDLIGMTARICAFSRSSTARPRWRGYCATPRQASYSMHTLPRTALVVFAHARQLGAEGTVSKKVDGAYQSGPCQVWIKVAIPRASPCSGRGATFGISDDHTAPPVTPRQHACKGIRQVALTVTHLYLKSTSRTCQTRVGVRSNLDSVRESSGDRHLADLSRGGYSAISFQFVFCELACGSDVPLPEFGSRSG